MIKQRATQFVDARIVNMLLAAYFAFIGAFALAATVDPILVQLLGTAVSTKGDMDLRSHASGERLFLSSRWGVLFILVNKRRRTLPADRVRNVFLGHTPVCALLLCPLYEQLAQHLCSSKNLNLALWQGLYR